MSELTFDFESWRAEQNGRRAARRQELREAFEKGLAVWHGGRIWSTAGVVNPGGGDPAAPYSSYSTSSVFAVFVEAKQSDPAFLAEHIESREYAFGFVTEIIRVGGGERDDGDARE